MPRCQCALTPCRTKVLSGEELCYFCATHCAVELARRAHRRRLLKFALTVAAIVVVSYLAGWFWQHLFRPVTLGG